MSISSISEYSSQINSSQLSKVKQEFQQQTSQQSTTTGNVASTSPKVAVSNNTKEVSAIGQGVVSDTLAQNQKTAALGNGTATGTSAFQQANEEISAMAEKIGEKAKEEAPETGGTDNFGNATSFGTSKFQQANAAISAVSSGDNAGVSGDSSGSGLEISKLVEKLKSSDTQTAFQQNADKLNNHSPEAAYKMLA